MLQQGPARLALIGCGALIQQHLLPALRRIDWVPAVLVDPVTRNLDAAARIAGKPSGLITVPDWAAATDAFDAAIVAVPHALHGPIGVALAKAGKHVFMEKPLAMSAAEARATVAAAEAGGTILSVGLLRRYLHVTRWTRALVQSGVLGRINRVTVREGFVFNWATSTDGLLRPELAGGGVLMDTGAHTLDQLLYWFGDATVIGYRDDSPRGIEADCEVVLALADGGRATVELSRSRELPNSCRIEGSNGFVELTLYRNEILDCSDNVRAFRHDGIGVDAMPEQRFPELFSAEMVAFRESIKLGKQTGVAGAEGIGSVALIEACYAQRQDLPMPWASLAPTRPEAPRVAPGTKVLVTGATGFIGGRLVERLLEQGAEVRCVVRSLGSAVRLARLPVEIIKADLADAKAIDAAVQGTDLVFHCAYDPRSETQNIAALKNLIDASLAHRLRRLVLTSTFSVYEPFPEGPVTEGTPDGDTNWVYTRTKLALERMLLEATRSRGLPGTILQPSIVYGPFSRPWTIAPAEMLLYGTVVLPDRGEGQCNALYIDDLVDAMLLSAQRPEAIGERFIISGPETVSWGCFFEEFASALGAKPPEYRPSAQIKKENSGLLRDIKMVAQNPKKLIQIAVRVPQIRTLLQRSLDSLPKPAYELVSRIYFGDGKRPTGMVHIPDPQLLRLYAGQATVASEKARRLLGYSPAFDFDRGMAATARYLQWAYGAMQESVAPMGAGTEPPPVLVQQPASSGDPRPVCAG
jgi:nucleoside-diphosphate-sugar epimerase/predicted dehydrogenase